MLLEDNFKNCNFNKLRISLAGGMQVQKSVAENWQKVSGNVLSVGYGLSETSPAASIDPIGVDKFSDTLGLPLPSTEISIQDDQGNHLDFNEPGEICIRGPQVMKGYWNNAEETNNVMTSDGWFKTGDIGIKDQEWSENIKLFISKVPHSNLTSQEIIDHCKKNLTGYKIPEFVEFIDEIPKSNVGKILRRKLRELKNE